MGNFYFLLCFTSFYSQVVHNICSGILFTHLLMDQETRIRTAFIFIEQALHKMLPIKYKPFTQNVFDTKISSMFILRLEEADRNDNAENIFQSEQFNTYIYIQFKSSGVTQNHRKKNNYIYACTTISIRTLNLKSLSRSKISHMYTLMHKDYHRIYMNMYQLLSLSLFIIHFESEWKKKGKQTGSGFELILMLFSLDCFCFVGVKVIINVLLSYIDNKFDGIYSIRYIVLVLHNGCLCLYSCLKSSLFDVENIHEYLLILSWYDVDVIRQCFGFCIIIIIVVMCFVENYYCVL